MKRIACLLAVLFVWLAGVQWRPWWIFAAGVSAWLGWMSAHRGNYAEDAFRAFGFPAVMGVMAIFFAAVVQGSGEMPGCALPIATAGGFAVFASVGMSALLLPERWRRRRHAH